MDEFQFYPTPPALAKRAWQKFREKDVSKLLEPSAGTGSLVEAGIRLNLVRSNDVDCCEIDIQRHPVLREHGYQVVGIDFLSMTQGAQYTHIIMNPPFADGAKHVLQAWNLLWDGEIVAIINADTLRNPYSAERKMLARLIEAHGDVEFIQDAFIGEGVERETAVEVALIWLNKNADVQLDVFGLTQDLKADAGPDAPDLGTMGNEVMLPTSTIENMVRVFDSAVEASRTAILASAKASHYAALLGGTLAEMQAEQGPAIVKQTAKLVQADIRKAYEKLKDRAWANVIRSTEVTKRLTARAQKEMEAQIEELKKLEFTVTNVYGLLQGLVENQGKMQSQVLCDVFDMITTYHTDNTVFYRGWKSNDKHRTNGWRIRTSRFILPGFKAASWRRSLDYSQLRELGDIDKAFALLEGKAKPDFGLVDLFEGPLGSKLWAGGREASDYFEVRWYPGAGTIHFYARDKKLIDRLNRFVGALREWIPPANQPVSDAFWLQYDKAEKFDRELRASAPLTKGNRYYDDPLADVLRNCYQPGMDEERGAAAQAKLDAGLREVLEAHGISPEFQLDDRVSPTTAELPLLPAAA